MQNDTPASRMTEKQKMLAGELYQACDPELTAARRAAEATLAHLNLCVDSATRRKLLTSLLGSFAEEANIRSPFFCDYGFNISIGRGAFLNFNCVLLDVMPIIIGEGTQVGPAVQIYAADHPRDGAIRLSGAECGKPVTIGANVWIGGGAILLPGITVGDDAIIGAGSVVTRDVPPGATVMGNPARLKTEQPQE